ncbi:MAG: NADH-quinone oxidoreductase subunit M, partial [Nakamurella sp.]
YVSSKDYTPTGVGTLDWAELRAIANQIPESTQLWIFAGFAIAFAIKAPLFPLHSWLPDAGAEAPVGSGTLVVGVLDKVGTFGFLRICLPLLPAASAKLAWLIITLSVIGIFYGGIVAAGQNDLKRFVTFTSIAHFGFIAMGVFAFTTQAMSGAVFYMVAHGLATGLLFLVVGMLTSRGGSRLASDYGGVAKVAPILAGMFLIGALATIALPGTSSFVAEFLVLIGTFKTLPVWGAIATVGIVIAAIYMLWMFQRTMTGPVRGVGVLLPEPDLSLSIAPATPQILPPAASGGAVLTARHAAPEAVPHAPAQLLPRLRFRDLTGREILVLTPLVALILLLGVYPKPVLDVINPTAAQIVIDSGHTDPAPAIEGANP